MNTITICGHLGKKPELKTGEKKSYCFLSISDKLNKDNTQWFDGIAYEKTAEYLCKYADKGDYVVASGYVTIRKKDDNNKVYQFNVTNIELKRKETEKEENPFA